MSIASISFASYQNSIASAYAPQRVAKVTSISTANNSERQPTAVATSLGSLLLVLAVGDVTASGVALSALSQATSEADDTTGQFTRLLARVSASLASGDTTPALTQIQQFLLASGRITGTSFSATV